MAKQSYQVTIKGLCTDDQGRILLVKEETGYWDLPGGRMEHGEDFHTTLARECREETGIACRILDAVPHLAWTARNYDNLWKVVLCFRIELAHLDFTPSPECIAIDFVHPAELGQLNVAPQIGQLQALLMHDDAVPKP